MSRRVLLVPAAAALILAAACSKTPAPPAGDEHASLTIDQAKSAAAEKGLPVLVDFWSPT